MLKELHISNYRLFDDLTIPDLGQVNLIAGKNNTGKTALLEALRIWAVRGDSSVVNHVLKNRGEFTPGWIGSYDSLFDRKLKFPPNELSTIILNDLNFVRLNDQKKIVVELSEKRKSRNITIKRFNSDELDPNTTPDYPIDNSIFVPFNNVPFPLQVLWENIVLTPLEDEVVDILKIVEPRLRRIDVNEENSKVLLEGNPKPAHLKSLGEGMSRLLWLAVALVSAKNSMLLIDEFEAGLHHSVQETLWEKVFQYAKEWNIQVFVTTHSMDTVRTFQEVAERPENIGVGKYFRLQRGQKGQIEAISYNEEELTTALEFELETR